METWKPVSDFEDTYEVSDLGRIRSLRPANLSQRRLSEDQVKLIHEMREGGFSSRKIAPLVGISQAIVCKIIRGDAYKDATEKILAPALRRDEIGRAHV